MNLQLQYITDAAGTKTSVIIPFAEWEAFAVQHQQLQKQLTILKNIQSGIKEVKDARKKGVELQSLTDFLNEC